MTIHYQVGDATRPIVKEGTRVIAHVCNDIGKWGAGFSGAISDRWKDPVDYYKAQHRHAKRFKLGETQWVFAELDIAVVNMIAQSGVRGRSNPKPIRYDALEQCLEKLAVGCRALKEKNAPADTVVSIHMPRIGCGLAGGSWDVVGELVGEALWDLDVYVYDLPP